MDEAKSDPLFYTHVKTFAATLLSLKQYKSLSDVYNFFGHPITKVELMGVVVGKVQKGSYTMVSVDDGTGIINCKLWHKKDTDTPDEKEQILQLGNLVQVWGRVQSYQDSREISIYNFRIVEDVNEEMLMWLDLVNVTLKSYIPNAWPNS